MKQICQEATTVGKTRGDNDLGSKSDDGGGGKWSDLRWILETEATRCVEGLDMVGIDD